MRILFQGDSITDADRARDNDIYLGRGYPALVKSVFNYEEPGKYEFFNRGVSGNRIVDLYARIRVDIINLNMQQRKLMQIKIFMHILLD